MARQSGCILHIFLNLRAYLLEPCDLPTATNFLAPLYSFPLSSTLFTLSQSLLMNSGRDVDAAGSHILDAGAAAIGAAMAENQGITKLYLGNNGVEEKGCAAVLESCRRNPRITHVYLDHNKLTSSSGRDIHTFLTRCKTLTVLDVRCVPQCDCCIILMTNQTTNHSVPPHESIHEMSSFGLDKHTLSPSFEMGFCSHSNDSKMLSFSLLQLKPTWQ